MKNRRVVLQRLSLVLVASTVLAAGPARPQGEICNSASCTPYQAGGYPHYAGGAAIGGDDAASVGQSGFGLPPQGYAGASPQQVSDFLPGGFGAKFYPQDGGAGAVISTVFDGDDASSFAPGAAAMTPLALTRGRSGYQASNFPRTLSGNGADMPSFGSSGAGITPAAGQAEIETSHMVDGSDLTIIALPGADISLGNFPTALAPGPVVEPAAAAVPEPATWAMFILGLGLVGGAQRAKRARRGRALA